MNKNLFQLFFGLLVTSNLFFLSCKSKDKVQIELQKIALAINKDCPLQNDLLMRMDSCRALPNRILEYNYTLLFSPHQIDTVSFRENAKASLLYNIQTNNEMRYLKDNKTTFVYSYKDGQADNWVDIIITADDYDKPAVKPKQINVWGLLLQETVSTESILEYLVSQMKKNLPIDFTEANISLLDCNLLSENTLEYTYKLHNVSTAQVDTAKYKKEKHHELLEYLKLDHTADILSGRGVFMRYIYLDKNGDYVLTFNISPEDYKQN